MESVYLLVNELTETFFADFNYGRSETKQMMPYCRISVEKYISDKVQFLNCSSPHHIQVYLQLFAIYSHKFEERSRLYNEKVAKIHETNICVQQFKYLDVILNSYFSFILLIDTP